jgi:hypothetical protein
VSYEDYFPQVNKPYDINSQVFQPFSTFTVNTVHQIFIIIKMFHQILITLILLTQTAINQKLICNNRALRVLDANVARIVTLGQSANSGRRFPENKEELKFFCESVLSHRCIAKNF